MNMKFVTIVLIFYLILANSMRSGYCMIHISINSSFSSDFDSISPANYELIRKFPEALPALRRCKTVIDTVLSFGKFIDKFTREDLIDLPVAVKKVFNNTTYIIAIDKITIHPDFVQCEVYAKIITPQGKELMFGSPDIKFSGSGGFVGGGHLGLLCDVPIEFAKKKALLKLKGIKENGGCFISFGCDGFESLGLDADILLSKDWVVPVDEQGTVIPNKVVIGRLSTIVYDYNDWIVDISLPNFALTKFPKIGFSIETVVFDFSDSANDGDVVFPPNYFEENAANENPLEIINMSPGTLAGNFENGSTGSGNSGSTNNSGSGNNNITPEDIKAWRGVYIKSFKIILPKEFLKRSDTTRLAFEARGVIIDSRGVSGVFEVKNLITLDQGRMGKWAYSLDYFNVGLRKSQLKSLGIGGRLELPVAGEDQTLEYSGGYDSHYNKYDLSVMLRSDLTFPIWNVSEVTLQACSFVKVAMVDNKFYPYANLSGKIAITCFEQGNEGKKNLEAPGILFEEMQLSTMNPYFNIKSLSLSAAIKIKGTPVTITEIGAGKVDDFITLYIGVDANMDGGEESGISASLGVSIYGRLVDEDDRQKFVLDKFKIEDGSLSGVFPGFAFRGSFKPFEGNEIYGSGFQATLEIGIKLKGNSKDKEFKPENYDFYIAAFGLFGKVGEPEYRYWIVDASIKFSPAIPVNALELCGFMGGAYRRMKLVGVIPKPFNDALGVTPSGNKYEPDDESGLGIRAGVNFKVVGTKSMAGSALFEFAFSSSGALDAIFFEGQVEMQIPIDKVEGLVNTMSKISEVANTNPTNLVSGLLKKNKAENQSSCQNTAKATIHIALNFEEQKYEANLDFDINMISGMLIGTGGASILIDLKNDKWHFYLGTFAEPIRLAVSLNSFHAEAKTYLMAGNDLPGFPPLSPQIAALLKIPPNKPEQDALAYKANLETGSGILFGAGVTVEFEKCIKGIVSFYGKANFYAGFEAGFLSFSEPKLCADGRGLGKNGWYNSARFYLFIELEVGTRKKCSKDFKKICNLDIGVFLAGQFPNPTYLEGRFYFRVCGISLSAQFENGEKCVL